MVSRKDTSKVEHLDSLNEGGEDGSVTTSGFLHHSLPRISNLLPVALLIWCPMKIDSLTLTVFAIPLQEGILFLQQTKQ